MRRQHGFSIISAIFILVVLSALGAFMVTISGIQHQSMLLGVESARATAAARSGLEWGGYQALENASCAASQTITLNEEALAGFAVVVTCSSSTHSERGDNVTVYQVGSTATRGTAGQPDFVRREFSAQFVDVN